MSAGISSTQPTPDADGRDVKDKQEAYHDWEADTYDEKFSISYDERCIAYARDRFTRVVAEGARFDRVLEVGTGTGFFIVNLWQAGFVGDDVHATDISEGMLQACKRNAAKVGLQVETRQGDAEDLPYDDDSFDLVIGHAFLHHLPDPAAALREMYRVLAPGGTLVVAGEPTLWGDRILQRVKHGTWLGWQALTWLPPLRSWRSAGTDHEGDDAELAALEHEVDLHTFDPADLERTARSAGFEDVRTVTEDLTAAWFGWAVRTLEGSGSDELFGTRWKFFAYRNYLRLQRFDDRLLSRFVPRELYYNVVLGATKPRT